MKTLGGVGAVVMGAMLLLTVKIGPAEPQPVPSSSQKMHPLAAFAAVPEASPRSTPAATPVSGPSNKMERRVMVVVPRVQGDQDADADHDADEGALPQAFECSFDLELPVSFSAL